MMTKLCRMCDKDLYHDFDRRNFNTLLESVPGTINIRGMKFFYACFVWLAIALILGLGLFLFAVKGSPWLFIASIIGFVVAVGKIGCATH